MVSIVKTAFVSHVFLTVKKLWSISSRTYSLVMILLTVSLSMASILCSHFWRDGIKQPTTVITIPAFLLFRSAGAFTPTFNRTFSSQPDEPTSVDHQVCLLSSTALKCLYHPTAGNGQNCLCSITTIRKIS